MAQCEPIEIGLIITTQFSGIFKRGAGEGAEANLEMLEGNLP